MEASVGSRSRASSSIHFSIGKGGGSDAAQRSVEYLAETIAQKTAIAVLAGNFHSDEMNDRRRTGSWNKKNSVHSFP